MGYFDGGDLDVRYVGIGKESGRPEWQLLQPFFFHSDLYGIDIEVPKWFVHDFASIPRLPFIFAYVGGLANQSSVIHDYLYYLHRNGPNPFPLEITKLMADNIFLEAMEAENVPLLKRKIMYAGVRSFNFW